MRYLALIFSGMIASTASIAHAQQQGDSVFGFQLQAPLSITECLTDGRFKVPKTPDVDPCYVRDTVRDSKGRFVTPTGTLGDEAMEIRFPFNNRPAIVAGKIRATLKGGRLASVIVFTGGQRTQESDLKLLVEKYGEPTRVTRPSYQNGFGAKSEGIEAEWERPSGAFVKLESPDMQMARLPTIGGPNVGTLRVLTAGAKAERDAREQTTDAQRTKL